MTNETKIDGDAVTRNAFRVKRPDGTYVTVTGPVSCDVRAGALVIFDRDASGAEVTSIVFGPGQWLNVNC